MYYPLPTAVRCLGRLRAQTPSGGSGPLRRACAPFAAKAAQGWRSPLRRRRQGLSPMWAVGPAALPCAGGFPRNAPLKTRLPTRPASAALRPRASRPRPAFATLGEASEGVSHFSLLTSHFSLLSPHSSCWDVCGQNRTVSRLILVSYDHNLRRRPQKVFFATFRGSSWIKKGVLCGPSWTDQIMILQRFSSWPLAALRGSKKVFSAALRGQTKL